MFCTVFLVDATVQSLTQEIEDLVDEMEGVSSWLHAQVQLHPSFTTALLRCLQYEFNKNFIQSPGRQHRFRWTGLDNLCCQLMSGHFRTDSAYMAGTLTPPPPYPSPPPYKYPVAIPPNPHTRQCRSSQGNKIQQKSTYGLCRHSRCKLVSASAPTLPRRPQ